MQYALNYSGTRLLSTENQNYSKSLRVDSVLKAYLETNTVQDCSYFGFGGYCLVAGTV